MGLSIADILLTIRGEGSSRYGRPHFLVQKTRDFVHTDKEGGVEPVRTFFGQGERGGQFFTILCGRLLWTVLYYKRLRTLMNIDT